MKLTVQLFALARDLAGAGEIELTLPDGATVMDARRCLAAQAPALNGLLPRCMFAVDADYAPNDRQLREGALLACIPPVSGG